MKLKHLSKTALLILIISVMNLYSQTSEIPSAEELNINNDISGEIEFFVPKPVADVPSVDEINRSSGENILGLSKKDIEDEAFMPDPNRIVDLEKQAEFDKRDLNKNKLSLKSTLKTSGDNRVIVRAFVNRYGKVLSTLIFYSDNDELNDAAEEAVKNTKFRPGIQNGKPVSSWVSVPVVF